MWRLERPDSRYLAELSDVQDLRDGDAAQTNLRRKRERSFTNDDGARGIGAFGVPRKAMRLACVDICYPNYLRTPWLWRINCHFRVRDTIVQRTRRWVLYFVKRTCFYPTLAIGVPSASCRSSAVIGLWAHQSGMKCIGVERIEHHVDAVQRTATVQARAMQHVKSGSMRSSDALLNLRMDDSYFFPDKSRHNP